MAAPYRVRAADPDAARALAEQVGVGPSVAQILLHRGVTEPEEAKALLDATLRGLTSPEGMADRAVAAARLAEAIRQKERVVVFGDYDVDGTTSAVIMTEVLQALGGDAVAIVADRFEGGYGLSEEALRRCLAEEPSVLVTCDCGSSDHPRIAAASDRGIDVIVVDHHLVPDAPLPAMAFLNPHRPECGFSYKGLCSAGLAFSLGAAIRAELGMKLDLRRWLDLVALGTIADLAPLDGDNRRLVRAGLKALGSTQARPALQALRQVAKLKASANLTATDVAFRFAPRVNAPGRLGESDLTLRFLQAQSAQEAWTLADQVEAHNDKRKITAAQAEEEAVTQVRELYGDTPSSGIVVASENWHRGVVGITAARLVDTFARPAVVIALSDGVGHGSARTIDGIDVHAALQQSSDHLSKWGGHRAAAGLSIEQNHIDAFRASFAEATAGAADYLAPPIEVDVALGDAFPLPTMDELSRLGPFGMGWDTPLFLIDAELVEATGVGEDKRHAKLLLKVGDQRLRAFAPNLFSAIDGRSSARLIGELQPDHWVGGDAIELLVKHVVD